MQLLVTGGKQDDAGMQILAVAMILDTDSGEIIREVTYRPEKELQVRDQQVHFTGNRFINDLWYVCTFTEVLVYDTWPPTEPVARLSNEGFNDLHDCCDWKGNLAISNTGLETVDVVDLEGNLLERYDVIGQETGPDKSRHRPIDPDKDYRLVSDTKPHMKHGNHLFELDGELWTSQLRTFNAMCVTKPSLPTLEMEVGMPHDGTPFGDRFGFTTTNGHLVFFEARPPHERTIYSLMDLTPGLRQLGWCRGMAQVPGQSDHFFVGFSNLRRSKWKEFGYWIKHGHEVPPARIALYDLAKGALVEQWKLGEYHAFQVFQIDVLPEQRCL